MLQVFEADLEDRNGRKKHFEGQHGVFFPFFRLDAFPSGRMDLWLSFFPSRLQPAFKMCSDCLAVSTLSLVVGFLVLYMQKGATL